MPSGSGGAGRISIVDARSAALVGTVSAGLDPDALAVDNATGCAFAVNGGTPSAPTANVSDPWRWLPAWLRRRLPFVPPPSPPIMGGTVMDATR